MEWLRIICVLFDKPFAPIKCADLKGEIAVIKGKAAGKAGVKLSEKHRRRAGLGYGQRINGYT